MRASTCSAAMTRRGASQDKSRIDLIMIDGWRYKDDDVNSSGLFH